MGWVGRWGRPDVGPEFCCKGGHGIGVAGRFAFSVAEVSKAWGVGGEVGADSFDEGFLPAWRCSGWEGVRIYLSPQGGVVMINKELVEKFF